MTLHQPGEPTRSEPSTEFGAGSPALVETLVAAVESAIDAVMITDADLEPPGPRIIYVNPAFCHMSGWSATELVGATPRVLQGPLTDRSVLDRLKSDLVTLGSFQGQAVNYRRDGTPFTMEWSISTVPGDLGEPRFYVAVQRDTTAFKRRLADAERQARTDELTGLANRRHFSAALAAAMADPEIAARAALLSLDIDKFKQVNDVHGHPAGDAVLREVARRIREAVREQDIVARTGGEEFAVLAIGPGGDKGLHDLAERIRRSVEREPVPYGGGTLPLTISVGVALAADSGGRIDGLVDRSDRALYEAKRTGRNRVVFASTAPGSS
jgi:diguanylate cyclase (GGDEF)-like protein/PAS domain S-box-containing protein